MRLVGKINSTLKYIKAYRVGNRVWLFYERELIEQREQKLGVIIPGDSRKQ